MSNENKSLANIITSAVVKHGAAGPMFKGIALSACSILLLTITAGIPDEFVALVRWPCYVTFVVGLGGAMWAMFRK